jgi:hypothetical protein
MSHNFKPGDFVKLKDRNTYNKFNIKEGTVAVVVATKDANPGNEYTSFACRNKAIFIKWLGVDSRLYHDGLWYAENFVDVNTPARSVDLAPFQIGDVVRLRIKDDLFMVVYTDWHRVEASQKFTKSMTTVTDDEDVIQTDELLANPAYVYVVSINAPTGSESCGGYWPNTLTLVKSRQDIEEFCKEE